MYGWGYKVKNGPFYSITMNILKGIAKETKIWVKQSIWGAVCPWAFGRRKTSNEEKKYTTTIAKFAWMRIKLSLKEVPGIYLQLIIDSVFGLLRHSHMCEESVKIVPWIRWKWKSYLRVLYIFKIWILLKWTKHHWISEKTCWKSHLASTLVSANLTSISSNTICPSYISSVHWKSHCETSTGKDFLLYTHCKFAGKKYNICMLLQFNAMPF